MALDSLTITLTDTRLIDGWVSAANANGLSPEALALDFLNTQGRSYAELFKVGLITGSAFIGRFTPAEYGAILAAAADTTVVPDPVIDPETGEITNQDAIDAANAQNAAVADIQGLLEQLFAEAMISFSDPRLEPGLALLVDRGLLDASRSAEILSYVRPEPEVTE